MGSTYTWCWLRTFCTTYYLVRRAERSPQNRDKSDTKAWYTSRVNRKYVDTTE